MTTPPLPKHDPKILAELLQQPGVKENVAQMEPGTLEWYKRLLLTNGIYAQYVKERKDGK